MKSNNEFRKKEMFSDRDDVIKKGNKLAPNKKSGKDKHHIFSSIDEEDDDDYALGKYQKRESVLDYFDDGDEDEDPDDYDEDEEYDDYDEDIEEDE